MLLGGCNNSNPVPSNPLPPQPPAEETENLQTYTDATYHFQFKYSSDFNVVTPNYALLSQKINQVQLPSSTFPKTNFGDGGFAVSVQTVTSEQECLSANMPEGSTGFNDTQTINGVIFHKTTGMGAGAGNFYESKTYRTLRNSMCYEISETIHTSNIANYDPGTVSEVDKNAVWTKLDEVLSTFTLSS